MSNADANAIILMMILRKRVLCNALLACRKSKFHITNRHLSSLFSAKVCHMCSRVTCRGRCKIKTTIVMGEEVLKIL